MYRFASRPSAAPLPGAWRAAASALALILAALAPARAVAQDTLAPMPAPLPPPVSAARDSLAGVAAVSIRGDDGVATLLYHHRPIVTFRAPLGAASPRERAEAAGRRLAVAAARPERDSVSTRSTPEGRLVEVDGRAIFLLTPADVDTASGGTLERASGEAAASLRAALGAEQQQRSVRFLVRAALASVLATLLFLLVLRLLRGGHDWTSARLTSVARHRVPTVSVRGFTVLGADQLLAALRRSVSLLFWVTGLFVAYVWLTFVLTAFPYSRPWGEALGAYLVGTVLGILAGIVSALPDIFTVVLIFAITRVAVRLVGAFFAAVEGGSVHVGWVHADTAQPTRRIAVALLWLFALVVAYPYLPGSDSEIFKGISVFIGLILSLGSTGLVNQAMSGLTIMYSRAVRPGEYVRIGDTEGTVVQLGLLSTKIVTPKRVEVTIPNTVVIGGTTTNFTRLCAEGGVLLHTAVTIGYDTPWRQVQAMLREAARRTPGLRPDAEPFVLQTALSDFYVEYELNVLVDEPHERRRVLSALHENIQDVFNEYGVQIMSPHYEGDPRAPAVVPRERWYAPPAAPPPPDARATRDGAGTDERPDNTVALAARPLGDLADESSP
ncbi:MAG TPA: mechanosensitive ion channel domain-containing protein [Gemmatimonadaceae bacterium]